MFTRRCTLSEWHYKQQNNNKNDFHVLCCIVFSRTARNSVRKVIMRNNLPREISFENLLFLKIEKQSTELWHLFQYFFSLRSKGLGQVIVEKFFHYSPKCFGWPFVDCFFFFNNRPLVKLINNYNLQIQHFWSNVYTQCLSVITWVSLEIAPTENNSEPRQGLSWPLPVVNVDLFVTKRQKHLSLQCRIFIILAILEIHHVHLWKAPVESSIALLAK